MLRRLILLLAFALSAGAQAQVAETESNEPIVITAIVQEQGVPYEPMGAIEDYGQSIKFIAWREGRGAISTQQLSLYIKVDTAEEQQVLQAPFRKGRLVRFEIEGPISYRGVNKDAQSASVLWGRLLEPVEDAELLEAAEQVWRPKPFVDAELGEFEPHSRLYDHFGQVRDWLGTETVFELILEPMGPNARDRALEMARIAWNDRARIDATIRQTIADSVYSSVSKQSDIMLVPVDGGEPITKVTEDDLPPLTRDEFRANHTLARISCSAQDYCSLQYVAKDIDWYWSYRATIRRDGEGWILDEWDFP